MATRRSAIDAHIRTKRSPPTVANAESVRAAVAAHVPSYIDDVILAWEVHENRLEDQVDNWERMRKKVRHWSSKLNPIIRFLARIGAEDSYSDSLSRKIKTVLTCEDSLRKFENGWAVSALQVNDLPRWLLFGGRARTDLAQNRPYGPASILDQEGKLSLWTMASLGKEQARIPPHEILRILWGQLAVSNLRETGRPPALDVGNTEVIREWMEIIMRIWTCTIRTGEDLHLGPWPADLQIQYIEHAQFMKEFMALAALSSEGTLLSPGISPPAFRSYLLGRIPWICTLSPKPLGQSSEDKMWFEGDDEDYMHDRTMYCITVLELDFAPEIIRLTPLEERWVAGGSQTSAELYMHWTADCVNAFLLQCKIVGVEPSVKICNVLKTLLSFLNELATHYPDLKVPIVVQLLPISKIAEADWMRCRSWEAFGCHGPEEPINVMEWEQATEYCLTPYKWADKMGWLRRVCFIIGVIYTLHHTETLEAAGHDFNRKLMHMLNLAQIYVTRQRPAQSHILPDTTIVPKFIRQAHKSTFRYSSLEQRHAAQKHVTGLRDRLHQWTSPEVAAQGSSKAKYGHGQDQHTRADPISSSAHAQSREDQRNHWGTSAGQERHRSPAVLDGDEAEGNRPSQRSRQEASHDDIADAGCGSTHSEEPTLTDAVHVIVTPTRQKRKRPPSILDGVDLDEGEDDRPRQRSRQDGSANDLADAGGGWSHTEEPTIAEEIHVIVTPTRQKRKRPPALLDGVDLDEGEDDRPRQRSRQDGSTNDLADAGGGWSHTEEPTVAEEIHVIVTPTRQKRKRPPAILDGVDLHEGEDDRPRQRSRQDETLHHNLLYDTEVPRENSSDVLEKALDGCTLRRRRERRSRRRLTAGDPLPGELDWDEQSGQYVPARIVTQNSRQQSAAGVNGEEDNTSSLKALPRYRGERRLTSSSSTGRNRTVTGLTEEVQLDFTMDDDSSPVSASLNVGATSSRASRQRGVESEEAEAVGSANSSTASPPLIPVLQHPIRCLCEEYYSRGSFREPAWPVLPIVEHKQKINGEPIVKYTEDNRQEAHNDIKPEFIEYDKLTAEAIREKGFVSSAWPEECTLMICIQLWTGKCLVCSSRRRPCRWCKPWMKDIPYQVYSEPSDIYRSGRIPSLNEVWLRLKALLGWTKQRPMMKDHDLDDVSHATEAKWEGDKEADWALRDGFSTYSKPPYPRGYNMNTTGNIAVELEPSMESGLSGQRDAEQSVGSSCYWVSEVRLIDVKIADGRLRADRGAELWSPGGQGAADTLHEKTKLEGAESCTTDGHEGETARDIAQVHGRLLALSVWKMGDVTTTCWREFCSLMMSAAGGTEDSEAGSGGIGERVCGGTAPGGNEEGQAFRTAAQRHAVDVFAATVNVCVRLSVGLREGISVMMGKQARREC
ncbi:hypothetical protein CALCODRAFT_509468 [Calocera cornea HHB12733]|uniref:Uncharacterized protein n=1 Tax=Calocera cornea HHB12733 TaxID=1353952 RepID=A0A165F8L3_9BASI|nr:hypothetical protein CALCODRAFT_509468 [Calocera cornea HHB12733]